MATNVVEHGRRKGSTRGGIDELQFIEHQKTKPSQVTVLTANEWQRMKGHVGSWEHANRTKVDQIHARKKALHEHSKSIVKNWENTIEGQRLKRLQAHQIREDEDEKERLKIDQQEAEFQAEQRKRFIEGAKTHLYYETDRVKQLHSALVLSEVIQERNAQVIHAKKRIDLIKAKDEALLKIQQEECKSAIIADMKAAEERSQRNAAIVQYQSKQAAGKINQKLQARLADLDEQKTIDKEAAEFQKNKEELVAENIMKQRKIKKELDNIIQDKSKSDDSERRRLEVNGEQMKIFTEAKRQMTILRKEKESELFQNFQNHQNYMCQQLQEKMQQVSSDEDKRTALAVKQQMAKREAEERSKHEKFMASTRDIHQHMLQQMAELKEKRKDEEKMDREMLAQRMIQDQKFHSQQLEKKIRAHQDAKYLQEFHNSQMKERKARKETEKEEDLTHYCRNLELLKVEETQFQQYANQILNEAKARGSHTYPLQEAAKNGAGGGHGPVMSDTGLQPSYQVFDDTAIELPSYSQDKNGKKTKTQQHLGFNW